MKLTDLLYVPQLDLLTPQTLFRIQAARARVGTVKRGHILLPPSHLMFGRFDLLGLPVGYFAESPETAAFESLFRREADSVSLAVLAKRSLLCVQSTHSLRLLDLRPHTQSWPVLQSLRFAHTQALAAEAFGEGFAGIVYRSAQQYGMDCYALFGDALGFLKASWRKPLLEPGTGNLHKVVVAAQMGSQVMLTP